MGQNTRAVVHRYQRVLGVSAYLIFLPRVRFDLNEFASRSLI